MLSDWIARTLEGGEVPDEGPLAGGRFRRHGDGIVELTPEVPGPAARACVLSVGIHGNETAPIELLDRCLGRLAAGELSLGAPVLLILGNLEAIRRGTRFVTTNLNRLFRRPLEEESLEEESLTAQGGEAERARTLMAAVDAFFSRCNTRYGHLRHTLPPLHYDLHTAIRDSRYPRFAVEPFAASPTAAEQWRWLAAAGIQAVLHQHQHSWTFSHYSRHYHEAAAFTLELGRAQPFGHNDLAPLAPMGALLEALLEGREPPGAEPSRMAFFRVEREVIRHAEAFRFHFADDIPNFTEFAPDTLLAEDGEAGQTRVGDRPLSVVFPNAGVELGARAALLVRPAPPPAP